jgi:mannan endo-1,6-alpha-mannosidase
LTDDGTIMVEIACESVKTCGTSMKILKGSFIQGLADITVVAPYTSSKILPLLQGSATAAAKTCTGGTSKSLCGARWYEQVFEDDGGIENQVAALSLFTSNLVAFNSHAPATQSTASNSTATTSGGNGTTTSSGAAAGTKTGSNAANVLTSSSVGVIIAVFAALFALF